MAKLKSLIDRYSTGKIVLILFTITNLVYAYILGISIPATMAFTNGLKLLDMMPGGYTPEYIQQLFQVLGDEGRATYLWRQIPADMLYPFLFGISNTLTMAYFLKKVKQFDSFFFYLCLLPLLAACADYLENISIISMLNSFPDLSLITMKMSSLFSIIKSSSTTVYFVTLLIFICTLGIQVFRKILKRG